MEEEDISERKLKIASILDRVKSFKTKYGLEDNWTDELTFTKSSADTTEHSGFFGHLVTEKTPEEWQIYLIKLENTGLPQSDRALLGKLIDNYSQAVESLPADQHSNNESYAKILVRFAELKALIDPDEARDQFQFARLNCKKYAFVHTSFAQFELSEGNYKKSKQILQKAIDCRAVPIKMLELALKNLNLKKQQLISLEEKENLSESNEEPAGYQSCILGNSQTTRNGSPEDVSVHINFLEGEKFSSPEESYGIGSKPLKTTTCPFGRVPLHSVTPPDIISDDSSTSSNAKRKPLTSINVTNFPSFSKPKEARDENQYSFGNVKFPVNHSPTNMEQSTEDSLEMNHFNRTSSTLTVKGNQDVHTFDQDTPVPQINFQENNTPFKPEPKVMADTKQPDPPKPNSAEKEWRWKVPETPNDIFSSEGRRMSLEPLSKPVSRCVQGPSLRKCDPVPECKTPVHKPKEDYMDCFRTPVMKKEVGPMSTPYDRLSDCGQPQTPANLFLRPGSFPVYTPQASNDCIVIKGRTFVVLKQIGTGGSSKVFQVMDEKKQLYAIKYVNLEEADQQTIESYQNEISHLKKLQQHCDKIIRLFDYEITDKHIYMVMECGNIDLNSWLRKKKTINAWERKSYWKNMLEAVHTIHQHGIVHSDLKPANFLIVDGMLKLIDFGIANQIQPDVTSIVKDSQVGTINYMPPEAIKDNTSYADNGKHRSKISPKGDVWSLGCILYCMTYGKTPFQHITNQIAKLHAILDPGYEIEVPDIPEKDLQDVLRKCLVRNPKERISIQELLMHPYVHLQPYPQQDNQVQKGSTEEMKRILGQLIGLNSPNSISRAARILYDQCSSSNGLDLSSIGKPANDNPWTLK